MKNLITVALIFITLNLSAIDRIVEEFGVAPAYNSINAAVAAAQDGDRIIIKNRAGDIPWIEDVTINKSLEFHSYENDGFFVVQGTYTLGKAESRVIKIVGMQNTSGNIVRSGSTIANSSMKVYIMDSHLVNGFINIQDHGIELHAVGNTIDSGYLFMAHGNAIGNNINTSGTNAISLRVFSTAPFLGDTCLVIGNVITTYNNSTSFGIEVNSSGQVVHVRNNWIKANNTTGIYVRSGNAVGVQNLVWNNSIQCMGTSSRGIQVFSVPNGAVWEIMNNAITRTSGSSTVAIQNAGSVSGQVNIYFNHFDPSFTSFVNGTFTFVGNNTSDQVITFNDDGTFASASGAIDGGNPAPVFYDLDLSPGDAGAYGGSFTLNNFHPLHTGAARVYYVNFPFNVRTGSTLNVKAYSFDR